ncbi:MAG: tRNA1(Val) (adenine(37)-N6)-methyltransferase [Nitratireductor sp.]
MLNIKSTTNYPSSSDVSEDDFFKGEFAVIQPKDKGHRSGLDALLIAAGVPQDAKGVLVDLGAGAGVAGMAAACANENLQTLLVEKNKTMLEFARKNIVLSKNSHFSNRLKVLEADVMLSGLEREKTGLVPNMADYVIMNPPYNHSGQRVSPDALKAEAHVMGVSGLDSWMRTAAAILKPGGILIMIYRTEKLGEVIACSTGRFGDLSIVPIHSKKDEAAKRLVVAMKKGSKGPLKIHSPIVMHNSDGTPTQMADQLLNGEARISFG